MKQKNKFQFLLSVLLSVTLAVLVSSFFVQAASCSDYQNIVQNMACIDNNFLYSPGGVLINTQRSVWGLTVIDGSVVFGTGGDDNFKLTSDGGIKAKVPVYVPGVLVDHKYALYLENTAITNNSLFSVRDDGNIGIGTLAPQSKLHVASDNKGYFLVDPSDGGLEIGSGNDGISYIDFKGNNNLGTDYQGRIRYNDGTGFSIEGGNVGIGTANSAAKLEVNGNLITTGNLTIKGGCTWYLNTTQCPSGKVVMGLRPYNSGDSENTYGYTSDSTNGGRPGLYGIHSIFNLDLCCGN